MHRALAVGIAALPALRDEQILKLATGKAALRVRGRKVTFHDVTCVFCKGRGKLWDVVCPSCRGDGFSPPVK